MNTLGMLMMIIMTEVLGAAIADLVIFNEPAVFYGNATGAAAVGLMIWWYYR